MPAVATASQRQIAIIQDNSDLVDAPAAMAQFRALGATTVRVFLPWATIAPNAKKTSAPKNFDATEPRRLQGRRVGARTTRSTGRPSSTA